MSVAPVSEEAFISAALVQALCACPSFQARCGVPTDAAARAFVVEGDGGVADDGFVLGVDGDRIDLAGVVAAVVGTVFPSEPTGRTPGVQRREGEATILLGLPPTPGDTPADAYRRALNDAGAIRRELRDQALTAGVPPLWGIGLTLGEVEPATGVQAGRYLVVLTVTWIVP